MKARAGRTVTRSISIDVEIDRALRKQAAAGFGGNVSTLIAAMARDALQRKAAGDLLSRFAIQPLSDDEAAALLVSCTTPEASTPAKRSRKVRKTKAA